MINKKITLGQIYDVVDKINKYGFLATYNFIGGFPHEELSEYKKTLQLIHYIFKHSSKVIYPISGPKFFTAFPGTILFHEAVKLGYCPPKTFREWSKVDYNNTELPWLDSNFRDFVLQSRTVVDDINQRFIGEEANIGGGDLYALENLME